MYRTSLIAITTLFLTVALVAQEPAVQCEPCVPICHPCEPTSCHPCEPMGDLEITAVQIMVQAFQDHEYETIEALFDKLSLESKKKFLQEAVAVSAMLYDPKFYLVELSEEELAQYGETRNKKTRFLGRLTLSLFEQSGTNPASTFTSQEVSERYSKVAVLHPSSEHPTTEPPSDDRVTQELAKVRPVAEGVSRTVKGITKELVADYADPPRILPLIGPAQLHHIHYKCTVNFEDARQEGSHRVDVDQRTEVLYIDLDYFRKVDPASVIPAQAEIQFMPSIQAQAKGTTFLRFYYVGDMKAIHNPNNLIDIITHVCQPDSWKEEDAVIAVHDATQSLAIRQTESVHAQIEDLLNQVRTALENQTLVR